MNHKCSRSLPRVDNIDHIFMCLLTICVSSSLKCLFKSFAHFHDLHVFFHIELLMSSKYFLYPFKNTCFANLVTDQYVFLNSVLWQAKFSVVKNSKLSSCESRFLLSLWIYCLPPACKQTPVNKDQWIWNPVHQCGSSEQADISFYFPGSFILLRFGLGFAMLNLGLLQPYS